MSEKSVAQISKALGAAFPSAAIQQRPGGKGKMLDYVQGHTVIHRLNDATGNVWNLRVLDQKVAGELLSVLVELEIPGLGTRQHMGVQRVASGSGEDLYKGAITDGLKKAATLFGVGLELYGEDYEAEPEPPPPPPTPLKVEDWPDERVLTKLGAEKLKDEQYQRLAVIYIGRAHDRTTLLQRTADVLANGPKAEDFKKLATGIATARGDELGLPRKGAAPPPQPADSIVDIVGEPEGNPQARRIALIRSLATQAGWDEARLSGMAKQLYGGDDFGKWSADQLDSLINFLRAGNHAAVAG
jgi:hypothetical protein